MHKVNCLAVFAFFLGGAPTAATGVADGVLGFANGSNGLKPSREVDKQGFNVKIWKNPSGVDADEISMLYYYSLGLNCWSILVKNPRFDLFAMADTKNITYLGTIGDPPGLKSVNPIPSKVYKINSGAFSNMFLVDIKIDKNRALAIMTREYTGTSPELNSLIVRHR